MIYSMQYAAPLLAHTSKNELSSGEMNLGNTAAAVPVIKDSHTRKKPLALASGYGGHGRDKTDRKRFLHLNGRLSGPLAFGEWPLLCIYFVL
jgi:hypothetical protein